MAIQTRLTTLRLDESTHAILNGLVSDFEFNKSQVVRRALRLMQELHEVKKLRGEVMLRTEKGEVLVLLS